MATIKPTVGLGGLLFTQTIKDFQEPLTNKIFEKGAIMTFDYSLDSEYLYLIIEAKNKEVEFDIDLFTGKIHSMICRKGYNGKLENNIGIGTSIKSALSIDKSLGFNLDANWFDRAPFDGLIIYPQIEFIDKCISAAIDGTAFPDCSIETIELIDLDFAKEHYPDGQLIFGKE